MASLTEGWTNAGLHMSNVPVGDISNTLRETLAGVTTPIFVGRYQELPRKVLEVGTLGDHPIADLKREIAARILPVDSEIAVRVVRHKADRLRRIRSLEALIAQTGKGELVFDRTLALGRSEAIVALGHRLRERLGTALSSLFFDGDRRTLIVMLPSDARSKQSHWDAREKITADIVEVEQAWRADMGTAAIEIAVRVGFALPAGIDAIAVDRVTVRKTVLQMLRRPVAGGLGAAVIGALAGGAIALPATAADLTLMLDPEPMYEPAVDEPNFSFQVLSGVARDPVMFDHLWAGLGAKATIPLGERFGAQLDLGVASDQYYGAGLHLFARDPSMGLVGIVGSAESQYGVTMNRIGAELEYYVSDNFTVAARVGYQGGGAPNGGFGRLDVKFYADPNLALSAGVEAQPSFVMGRVGLEWRPALDALPGMSVTADANATSAGNYRATFGLHFQVGGSTDSILSRDRKSDPSSAIWNQIDTSSAAYGGPV
jgi:hypothetical protein